MDESVRVDAIRVRELVIPFKIPFRISSGVLPVRRSLIIELESDGAVGYGESAPNEEPFYSEETVGTVRTIYDELYLPRLVGKRFESIDAFDQELRRGVRGNYFARAGLENAYWDLCCHRSDTPLVDAIAARLARLGLSEEHLRPSSSVPSGVAVGIPDDGELETLKRQVAGYLEEGYRRVKIKIRPGWEVGACRAVREVAGDEFPFWTDANASFELSRHLDSFRAMDDFHLLFHEQPLHHRDLLDHSKLAKEIDTPLCLDESLTSTRAGRDALELDAARIWNIKVQRLGGLRESIALYQLAVSNDVRLWGGTMPESGIGGQAILALAAFPGFVFPADIEASSRWYEDGHDPVELTMSRDGRIPVPRRAGIEAVLDKERYERFSKVVLTARS